MSISTTIQSMYENVGEVYDTITNVSLPSHKNIENIPSTIRDSYLEIMNNGIEVIWENWEKVLGEGTSLTLSNTVEAPMKIEYVGNTSQEGTPTPDSPQPIHVVSGDNTVEVVGKNLFNGVLSSGYYITSTKALTNTTSTIYKSFEINLKAGNYVLSCNTNINIVRAFTDYNNSSDAIFAGTTMNVKSYSMNITQDTKLYLSIRRNDNTDWLTTDLLQLEKGSTATTYEPHTSNTYPINLGAYELCSIGDYKDRLFKTSGKNLFGGTIYQGLITEQGIYWVGTTRITNANSDTMKTFILKKGTYTLSIENLNYCTVIIKDSAGNVVQDFANEWKSLPFTFTTTEEGYFYFSARKTDNSNISPSDYRVQLNKGETALPYEPYGTGWYLEKKIGKVVLNGTENWSFVNQTSYMRSFLAISDINTSITDTTLTPISSNYFKAGIYNSHILNTITGRYNNAQINIFHDIATSNDDFKTWLSTHNTTVYYVLATPTYTKIEGTLKEQLEEIKKSKDGQTNISQTNNDLPFVLDVSALKE